MPGAGRLRDRITFQQRGLDANGDPLGPWADVVTVSVELIWLRGGEAVMDQRLAGRQPVVITVRDFAETRLIDNSWRAVNERKPAQVFDIKSASPAKELGFIDVLAEMVRGE